MIDGGDEERGWEGCKRMGEGVRGWERV